MATVEKLIERIEKRLAMASGIDVQVHAEDVFVEMLRHKYETLFDDRWWIDQLTLETFTLDGSTGMITADVSTKIKRFSDINSVYLGGNQRPLPLLMVNSNPTLFMGEAVSPVASNPQKVFRVWPNDRADDVHVWYRTRLNDEDWDIEQAAITNVNLDSELLILGVAYDYLADDGSNPDAVQKYEAQYNKRYQQLISTELQQGVPKHDQARGIPTQWRMT